jgi:hypothetical protein
VKTLIMAAAVLVCVTSTKAAAEAWTCTYTVPMGSGTVSSQDRKSLLRRPEAISALLIACSNCRSRERLDVPSKDPRRSPRLRAALSPASAARFDDAGV